MGETRSEVLILETLDIPIAQLKPNSWNPNRQTARQYEAEIESILSNGFVMPIVARQKSANSYEIIDGEHRYRALNEIIENDMQGKHNIPAIKETKSVPVIVLNISEPEAKRLTIILNETRGSANTAELSALLSELSETFQNELITGLPYTASELDHLLDIGEYDWDSLTKPLDSDFDNTEAEDEDTSHLKLVHMKLDDETYEAWRALCESKGVEVVDSVGAGIVFRNMLIS